MNLKPVDRIRFLVWGCQVNRLSSLHDILPRTTIHSPRLYLINSETHQTAE